MLFVKPYFNFLGKRIYCHRTPSELEDLERAKHERKQQRVIRQEQKREVKYLAKALPVWLAKMGHAYWFKKSEKDLMKGHFNPVKFLKAQIGEDAYYFKIATSRLPRGVMISHLKDPDVLETLSKAAGSQVRFHDEPTGCWYSVETRWGRGSIPTMVGYAEMLKMMPPDAPAMAFPLGMGENQKPFFGDLEKMINLLVGGTKGGGKSNAVNVMLCTILARNTPQQIRCFLTDLKGGIEFADYNGIPHLGGDVFYIETGGGASEGEDGKKKAKHFSCKTVPKGYKPKGGELLKPGLGDKIYTEPYEVIPMLAYVESELDRRAHLLAGHAKKISTYNKRFPDKALSYWLVVVDELATLMEDPKYKKQAVLSLSEIARKGRAVGIHLVLATQTPSSQIVPQQVANNMDSRLAFRTGSGVASGILLGSGEYDASQLPGIPGRFIWKWGGDKIQMQAPFIADSTVRSTIAQLRSNKYIDARAAELAQKADHLFRFALNQLNGECQSNRLYSFVKGDGFKKAEVMKILDQYEVGENGQPEILIDDEAYYLVPPIQAKRIARWLVPVSDVLARKHPNPDFNYDLVSRIPHAEISETAVREEIQNFNGLQKNSQIEQSDNLPIEPFEPISANGHRANGDIANGSIEHTSMELLASEPVTEEPLELEAIGEDEIEWGSQWHILDEEPEPEPDGALVPPAWLKKLNQRHSSRKDGS